MKDYISTRAGYLPRITKGLALTWLLFFVAGCMGGRFLDLDIRYDPIRKHDASSKAAVIKVALIPLIDSRTDKSTIGEWVGLRGKKDIFRSAKPLGQAVTEAVFDHLSKTGFDIKLLGETARPSDFTGPPPDRVIYGYIERFNITGTSYVGATRVKADIRLRIVIKNLVDGSTKTINIEGSSKPMTVVSHDPDVFAKTVNDVLSDTVEHIRIDSVLK